MEAILVAFLVGFLLGTFYLHIDFWTDVIGTDDEKIMIVTLFTIPLFPIFGVIQLFRRILNKMIEAI